MKLAINLLRGDAATQNELNSLARLAEVHDQELEVRINATRQRLEEAVSRSWLTAQRDNIARVEGARYDHPRASI
jgi:hypothetical protein